MKRTILVVLVFSLCLLCGCGGTAEKEQYIDVNGVRLAYVEQGTGQPLILLHGGGGSSHDFDHIIGRLAEDYHVFAIDSRGQGKSSEIEEYHYQDMADDVAAFIEEKNLKDANLYGFSDGGIIGLILASQHPDLLTKMIISGANMEPEGMQEDVWEDMKKQFELTGDGLLKMELKEPDLTKKDLGNIKIPVLVLAGSDDMIKEDHTRFLADCIPNSQLKILEGETHTSYVLHDTKIADLIERFLGE